MRPLLSISSRGRGVTFLFHVLGFTVSNGLAVRGFKGLALRGFFLDAYIAGPASSQGFLEGIFGSLVTLLVADVDRFASSRTDCNALITFGLYLLFRRSSSDVVPFVLLVVVKAAGEDLRRSLVVGGLLLMVTHDFQNYEPHSDETLK